MESFFYEIAPDYYHANTGELRCFKSRVDHLREAMPFDRIQVTMSLKALYECGVILFFEYYRLKHKLATGEHKVAWFNEKGNIAPLPLEIKSVVLKKIE